MSDILFRATLIWTSSHQLSCLTGAILWTIFVALFWKKTKIKTYWQAMGVGIYWFFLTFLVETFFLNKIMGKMTWEEIIRTYDISKGEYWGLVLIWIGLLPVLIRFFKSRSL
jgi:hypothetical protein